MISEDLSVSDIKLEENSPALLSSYKKREPGSFGVQPVVTQKIGGEIKGNSPVKTDHQKTLERIKDLNEQEKRVEDELRNLQIAKNEYDNLIARLKAELNTQPEITVTDPIKGEGSAPDNEPDPKMGIINNSAPSVSQTIPEIKKDLSLTEVILAKGPRNNSVLRPTFSTKKDWVAERFISKPPKDEMATPYLSESPDGEFMKIDAEILQKPENIDVKDSSISTEGLKVEVKEQINPVEPREKIEDEVSAPDQANSQPLTPEPLANINQQEKISAEGKQKAVHNLNETLTENRGNNWQNYFIFGQPLSPETQVKEEASWIESLPPEQRVILEELNSPLSLEVFIGNHIKDAISPDFYKKVLDSTCIDIVEGKTKPSIFDKSGSEIDRRRQEIKDLLDSIDKLNTVSLGNKEEEHTSVDLKVGDFINHVKSNIVRATKI